MNPRMPENIFWMRRARALRRRVNTALWFERFAPAAFAWGLVGTVGILAARGAGFPISWPLAFTAAGLVTTGLWVRRRLLHVFERDEDALARLDLVHGLHNRLSSARAGVGDWPAPVLAATLRWRRSRASDLCLVAGALLIAACLVPAGVVAAMRPAERPEPPPALRDLFSTTKRLREEKATDPKALDALEERAKALLRQPESAWYDATTMEAAEHLRDRAGESLRDLDKDLATLKSVTDRVAETGELMPDELAASLSRELAEAMEGLDLSALPPSKELRDKLGKLSLTSLKALDKKTLDELRRTLAEQRRRLRRAGEKAGAKAARRASSEGLPVFLFATGSLGPNTLMKTALGVTSSAAVDTGLAPASPAELEIIRASLQKAKPRIRAQAGCKPGMEVVGVVPMPLPEGSDPAADDDLLDALEDLVYGDAYAVFEFEPERRALTAALAAGRIRLVPFSIKDCNGNCQNGSCEKPGGALVLVMGGAGNGGPGGGGGPAALTLGDKTSAQAGGSEQLNANDRSHDTLGDLEGLSSGKHKVDKDAYKGPVSAGAVASPGEGAEAVWSDNLTPEERETLRRYFK